MNNEPQASQETIGESSSGDSTGSEIVAKVKKYSKYIAVVILAIIIIYETIVSQRDVVVDLNINSASSPPTTKTWTTVHAPGSTTATSEQAGDG